MELVDLTGEEEDELERLGRMDEEEARTRDIDQTGAEVPGTGPGDFGDEDDFEQGHLLDFFNAEYQEAGGVVPISNLVDNHYEPLRRMSSEDIKRFRKAGTYDDIQKLLSSIEQWSTEEEGKARYQVFHSLPRDFEKHKFFYFKTARRPKR